MIHFKKSSPSLNQDQLFLFTMHLQLMLLCGVQIVKALEIFSEGSEADVREVCRRLCVDVMGGHYLSQALSKQPESFPNSYWRVIQTGEASGQLPRALERLGNGLEQQQNLKRILKSALTYPLVLLVSCTVMIGIALYLVFPMLLKVTENAGVEPPALTRLVMILASPKLFLVVAGCLAVAALLLFLALRDPRYGGPIREFWETYTPPGRFHARTRALTAVRQLAMMQECGIVLVRALRLAGQVGSDSILVERAFKDMEQLIKEGESLHCGFARHTVFPPSIPSMVAVAEESGSTHTMLFRVCDILEEEMQTRVEVFSAALEPILLGVMGMIIGTLLLAAFLPIYSLVNL